MSPSRGMAGLTKLFLLHLHWKWEWQLFFLKCLNAFQGSTTETQFCAQGTCFSPTSARGRFHQNCHWSVRTVIEVTALYGRRHQDWKHLGWLSPVFLPARGSSDEGHWVFCTDEPAVRLPSCWELRIGGHGVMSILYMLSFIFTTRPTRSHISRGNHSHTPGEMNQAEDNVTGALEASTGQPCWKQSSELETISIPIFSHEETKLIEVTYPSHRYGGYVRMWNQITLSDFLNLPEISKSLPKSWGMTRPPKGLRAQQGVT